MSKIDLLTEFVKKRPESIGAFGYGSKVFKQLGYDSKTKAQLDIIFIVQDMKLWHKENSSQNPKDYSYIGKKFLTTDRIDDIKGHTKMTFQSNIKENNATFKYGVIEYYDFLRALNTWDSFFVTGRFQKPILEIKSNSLINDAINANREKALYVALLTMNPLLNTLDDLYQAIGNLSYMGDTRMKIAENPHKVKNIVGGNFDYFKDIYGTGNQLFKSNDRGIIAKDQSAMLSNVSNLPTSLLKYLESNNCNMQDLCEIKEYILNYLTIMNENESCEQTIKGIKTNGIIRSLSYAIPKVKKKVKSLSIKG